MTKERNYDMLNENDLFDNVITDNIELEDDILELERRSQESEIRNLLGKNKGVLCE